MKTFAIALAVTGLAAGAAQAQSFAFDGAELAFQSFDSDDDYSGQYLRGSAEVSFGRFGAQLDLTQFGYNGETEYTSYGLHLFYGVTDQITVGVFYEDDDWDGDVYGSSGFEAAYDNGQISGQLAAGRYEERDGAYEFDFTQIDIGYELQPGLSVLGEITKTSGSEDLGIVGIGARYETQSGLFAEAMVAQYSEDYDHKVISFEVGYAFGGGTTFDQRDWAGIIGLY